MKSVLFVLCFLIAISVGGEQNVSQKTDTAFQVINQTIDKKTQEAREPINSALIEVREIGRGYDSLRNEIQMLQQ